MTPRQTPTAFAFLAAIALGGCASEPARQAPAPVTVETHGALRDFMHGGQATTVVQLETLAAEGQLAAYRHDGFWQCVDTLRDLRYLRSFWEKSEAPWKVWEE